MAAVVGSLLTLGRGDILLYKVLQRAAFHTFTLPTVRRLDTILLRSPDTA
jgi:hypothetical protein